MVRKFGELVVEESATSVFRRSGHQPRDRSLANTERRERRISERGTQTVIAWDGEGIDLHGKGHPQSYVLFGCSVESDTPLVIDSPDDSLGHVALCEYICDVGSRHPHAVHMGYGFGYDQNMMIAAMPLKWKQRLYKGKAVRFYNDKHTSQYTVTILWRKRFQVSRVVIATGVRVTVRIDDIVPFFRCKFIDAYEKIVNRKTREWYIVTEGKDARGSNTWENMPAVVTYWVAEIAMLAELGTALRDLMFEGGFPLTSWYGPGVLANYLRKHHKLNVHEWGAKEANLPAAVHIAAKSAMVGGHFEPFMLGRFVGPIYSIDLNSAYPAAFTHIPTLREGGFWRHVEGPVPNDLRFGVYRLLYRDDEWVNELHNSPRRSVDPHPLPHRREHGEISYPAITEGWYWYPEAKMVQDLYPDKTTIYEGWEWIPASDEHPWRDLMTTMFATRKVLKAAGNLAEYSYKLGMNCLFGKAAQRVGWNTTTNTPPASHALAIAGFITSFCRSQLMYVMAQIPNGKLIAVETDGVYTTADPALLELPSGIGPELGQWDLETYDECYYVQSGIYYLRKGDEWVKTKSRGFSAELVPPAAIAEYLKTLQPRSKWEPLQIEKKVHSFLALGTALQRATNGRGEVVPPKFNNLHCQWVDETRKLDPGGKGKRAHVAAECWACQNGWNAYQAPHTLCSNHGMTGKVIKYSLSKGEDEAPMWPLQSEPHLLPWETTEREWWRGAAEFEMERIEEDIVFAMGG